MKYIALFAILAGSMLIGACASKPTPTTSTTVATGSGYKK